MTVLRKRGYDRNPDEADQDEGVRDHAAVTAELKRRIAAMSDEELREHRAKSRGGSGGIYPPGL